MKNVTLILLTACSLAACNNNQSEQKKLEAVQKTTIDSMKTVITKQKVIDSMKATVPRNVETRNVDNNAQAQGSGNNSQPTAVETKKKKGWSPAAKGAVIGAGTGAVAGAIIDKKHGEGAVVGGLIGAGVGAATGAIITDSKKKKAKAKP